MYVKSPPELDEHQRERSSKCISLEVSLEKSLLQTLQPAEPAELDEHPPQKNKSSKCISLQVSSEESLLQTLQPAELDEDQQQHKHNTKIF